LNIKILALVLILTAIASSITYVTVNYRAEAEYNRDFGTYALVAMQSSSLNKSWSNTLTLWQNMNATFDPAKFNETFNTIPLFGFDAAIKYENSLAAQNDYFQGLHDLYLNDLKTLNQNTGFNSEMNLVYEYRNEANSNGGMDWVIHNAYLIQNYPLAYWSWLIYAAIASAAIICGAIAIKVE